MSLISQIGASAPKNPRPCFLRSRSRRLRSAAALIVSASSRPHDLHSRIVTAKINDADVAAEGGCDQLQKLVTGRDIGREEPGPGPPRTDPRHVGGPQRLHAPRRVDELGFVAERQPGGVGDGAHGRTRLTL